MVARAVLWGLGAAACGLAALLGAQSNSTPAPSPAPDPGLAPAAGCSFSGGKLLTPPLSDAAACARFMAAIAPAGAVRAVSLKLLPQGVASAAVTHTHAGETRHDTFELAVSDRPLAPQDLDKLAADVVAGLARLPR